METQRILDAGTPDMEKCDNAIRTSKYSILSFFPVAISEQFRRVANVYFFLIGCIMWVGFYTDAFDSAISPWTTFGPLTIIIAISLLQEGSADVARHRSDDITNMHPCVIMRRSEDLESEEGSKRATNILGGNDVTVNLKKDVYDTTHSVPRTPRNGAGPGLCSIAYQTVVRQNLRAGHIIMVRNREMIPTDMIILATSSNSGSAYIETSSIDGETNLKLRTCPHLPKNVLKQIRAQNAEDFGTIEEGDEKPIELETLEHATKRIARFSSLCYPRGISSLQNPNNPLVEGEEVEEEATKRPSYLLRKYRENMPHGATEPEPDDDSETHYVATLTSESPNASVNTYSGKLTLPPVDKDGPSIVIPLGADNILLRGAMLRNTEWAIGLAVFTGTDTKLVQNASETPSKFSQLELLMNRTVLLILCVMFVCIASLSIFSVTSTEENFGSLWYTGKNTNTSAAWPYLAGVGIDTAPKWTTKSNNIVQQFFLFVTLLSNFVPLSLYVTVEVCTFCLLWFVRNDIDMYHEKTDTAAIARSTNVTDLGQVQYIFSDKTGTLTQNVMRFKRCSVDGMVFGAPVEIAPKGESTPDVEPKEGRTPFHPLRQLLVGRVEVKATPGLEGLGKEGMVDDLAVSAVPEGDKLTFNAEMFLRVMSICHTVVVEKEYEANIANDADEESVGSEPTRWSARANNNIKKFFKSSKKSADAIGSVTAPLETPSMGGTPMNSISEHIKDDSKHGVYTFDNLPPNKAKDGAPLGFVYQAESPDEGALVSAASSNFDFQVSGRDSNGVTLSVTSPSLLQDKRILDGLKTGDISPRSIACETAEKQPARTLSKNGDSGADTGADERSETWAILAVNKFDSTRKRMSVLVRSPPELGSMPMLLCKGADSAMLGEGICDGYEKLMTGEETPHDVLRLSFSSKSPRRPSEGMRSVEEEEPEEPVENADAWETATLLGIQAHLGDFAKEGLRTLVLGVRILTDKECDDWLSVYTAAATSIKGREEKLVDAAMAIESNLHIVGATAIEDKLQRGVPETIVTLEKAGIKLWVLTGDKRETAIEIGYSTHVLTNKMHLTEVADGPSDQVKTILAMEFMRLIKMGKLEDYQKSVLDKAKNNGAWSDRMFLFQQRKRKAKRMIKTFFRRFICCFLGKDSVDAALEKINAEAAKDSIKMLPTDRRSAVRDRVEKIIQDYLESPEGTALRDPNRANRPEADSVEVFFSGDKLPGVFNRASSAKALLDIHKSSGLLAGSEVRTLSLAQITSQQLESGEVPLVDEDVLSMESFVAGGSHDKGTFDKKRRTLLEKMFAVDSSVRHGTTFKHLSKEKLRTIAEGAVAEPVASTEAEKAGSRETPRALVIEGAALSHLLGDPMLEEILFGVASNCESVIACRVSPKQKALVVRLVRDNVSPEPVTLAIGDGANDVGMIQEAHVGVGISGLEGQQAVNASDFAIAQFRFLEELLLIHGRWSFFRMSTVVLFSFYKNALMAGIIIAYASSNLYSGTPLFDEWFIAGLNFFAAAPICAYGIFDRCLEKDYILKHPEVYSAGRNNELMSLRVTLRWVFMTFVHIFSIYYLSVAPQADGGGITPAFSGLAYSIDQDHPGDAEGGDLKVTGAVTYTIMIIILGLKVLLEGKSLLHGKWPAFTCSKTRGEGFFNRVGYTWQLLFWLSFGFYAFFLFVYQELGKVRVSPFFPFVNCTYHFLVPRSITYMLFILVPSATMCFDVVGKVFSNMFYPTQTQIHIEISAQEERELKRRARGASIPVNESNRVEEV